VRFTRRNLDLISRGNVSEEMLSETYQRVGAFQPSMQLILDRIYKAITEFKKTVDEMSALHREKSEERVARKLRERAAAGSCLICSDSNPDIATLCCGKAFHLNCVAEWLSNNNSCPQCRSELPRMPTRMRRISSTDDDDHIISSLNVNNSESTTITLDWNVHARLVILRAEAILRARRRHHDRGRR
jgi:hypothetical protein